MEFDIYSLFEADSLKDVKRVASEITVSSDDIYQLICLANANIVEFPYKHASKFHEEIPKDLALTEKNMAAISNAPVGPFDKGSKKAINKLLQMPLQSKRTMGHLFYNPDHTYWHLFYFDIRDTREGENHWKGGSHIHYVSFLWPNLSCSVAWEKFCKSGKKDMGKDLHIKFKR